MSLIGIVRRQLPCAFFTDHINAIDDVIQKMSLVLDAFCKHQIVQLLTAGELFVLKMDPVAGAGKIEIVGGIDHRPWTSLGT